MLQVIRLFLFLLLIAVLSVGGYALLYLLFWQRLLVPIAKVVRWKWFEYQKASEGVEEVLKDVKEHETKGKR